MSLIKDFSPSGYAGILTCKFLQLSKCELKAEAGVGSGEVLVLVIADVAEFEADMGAERED